MRNVLDFIVRHNAWLLFVLLEAVSLTLLLQAGAYQSATWVTTANTAAGAVYATEAKLEQFFHMAHHNEELTRRNIYLEHCVRQLSDDLADATGTAPDSAGTMQSALRDYQLIPAKVVQNSVNQRDNLITIDRGTADGVSRDMAVVSGKGIVGIVYLAGEHYAVVIPVLSSKSSISCSIAKRGYFGYLHWDGGPANIAYVDDVPRHAHFRLYDTVVTSGYSAVFPPGLAVGKILHVQNSADGVAYRLVVQLYTDFGNLRDVCVITDSHAAERLQLLRAAQDSLATN